MKLTKNHNVLESKQSDWMKKYIDFNTEKRTNAANDFEKDFFKLMINSVYGKTMENLQKRINVRLVNNTKDFLKYTSKPTYITYKMFGKYYAATHDIKPVLILNKPIYVGFTVLDLSKWKMYDFHCIFIKKNFFKWKDLFDFSNYSKDSKFFDETNKKVIGKMKDEFGGVIVIKFVGKSQKFIL